jgi:hypothetical protein
MREMLELFIDVGWPQLASCLIDQTNYFADANHLAPCGINTVPGVYIVTILSFSSSSETTTYRIPEADPIALSAEITSYKLIIWAPEADETRFCVTRSSYYKIPSIVWRLGWHADAARGPHGLPLRF